MKKPKKIAPFLPQTFGFDPEEMKALVAAAKRVKDQAWDEKNDDLSAVEKALVKRFKSDLKDHLHIVVQNKTCCFCGDVLGPYKSTYDLEHLINKSGRTNVVFDLRNLALSCKPCNSTKSTKKVTVWPLEDDADSVFDGSGSYRIVHPHFDEWGDHLSFDPYNRVIAKGNGSFTKGRVTIQICGIDRTNAMRLSDHFECFKESAQQYRDWLDFYVTICSEEDLTRKRKYKVFLENVLNQATDPAAFQLKAVIAPLLQAIP